MAGDQKGAGAAGGHRAGVLRASLLMLLAAACGALDAAIIRLVSAELHAFEIAFFRNLFSLLAFLPWLLRAGPAVLGSPRLPLHLARAALKLGALVAYFWALAVLPLADVTAIAFATPLFVALGAVLLLGELIGPRRWLAIAIGFAGVLIVLRPGSAMFDPRMLAAVAAAIGLAGVALMLKFLAGRETTATIVGLNLGLSVPLALLLALPVWVTPGPGLLALLAVQGVLGVLSQTAVARAMGRADVSFLMPIDFMRLPLVALIAFLAFDEVADLWTWAGGAVIFAATLYLTRREAARPGVPGRGGTTLPEAEVGSVATRPEER